MKKRLPTFETEKRRRKFFGTANQGRISVNERGCLKDKYLS